MMRQTTEHRSYTGSAPVRSRHVLIPSCGIAARRRGFTLVEVIVAAAILIILLIGLAGMFARGVSGFKQAQLVTMAQNLAEFQVEDLKNLAPSALNNLVRGAGGDVNYPYSGSVLDLEDWAYDSGSLATDFIVDGVEQLQGRTTLFIAGRNATTIPSVPSETELLLGQNIMVRVYLIDDFNRTFWKDSEADGFYYLDGAGLPVYVAPPVPTPFDPLNDLFYYYEIVLQKEAYPLFARQVRIVQYSADAPEDFDPWDLSEDDYRTYTYESRTAMKFNYEITIWYKQSGLDRVLFRSGGTIAWPFTSANADRRIA